jgi:cytochrome c5
MRRSSASTVLLLALAAISMAACGGGTSSSAQAPPASSSAPTENAKVDLEAIFPPGEGRDLVLSSCQNCHTFVPIVILQMDKDAWARNSRDHRERVSSLTEPQFQQVYEYLTTNFGPHRPVPELPPELLQSWTTY